jgi:hypothetical protein
MKHEGSVWSTKPAAIHIPVIELFVPLVKKEGKAELTGRVVLECFLLCDDVMNNRIPNQWNLSKVSTNEVLNDRTI